MRSRRKLTKQALALVISALVSSSFAATAGAQIDNATRCSLRGVSRIASNTAIFAPDGRAIARFSGAESPLVVSSFPVDAKGRAEVETGTGAGSFRIKGQIDASKIPVFTAQSVPVVAGHVWLGAERRVTVVSAAPGRLKVQKVVTTPLQQTFTAWGPCSAFSLTAKTPPGWTVPGHARGFVLKQGSLDVFDGGGANNTLITTLFRAPESEGVLFFSTEQRGAWVHIEYHGEIVVDAWARLADLKPLPPGETMDQLVPPTTQANAPRLALQNAPRTVRTTREVPLRTAAKDADPVIGVIETGTDTLVIDVMAGWASVMPKSLNVLPPEHGQFWVKAKDIGL